MSGGPVSALRIGLRTGAVVLTILVVGIGCKFMPPSGVAPPPSSFFAGCFEGEAAGQDTIGSVTLVLESDEGSDPNMPLQLSLRGCMDLEVDARDETIALTGQVLESSLEEAELSGVFNDGIPIEIEVERSPEGKVEAESVTIRGTGGEFITDVTEPCEESFESLCSAMLLAGGGGGA